MVRSEDIPILKNIPVGLTLKAIRVVDLTGAMPVVSISSEDVSGEVFGFFRFNLSVYYFENDVAYVFLISKEAVPLDPVNEVTRAQLGDHVIATLEGYTVTETERIQIAEHMTLEQVDLLIPSEVDDPIIMTRHPDLKPANYLSTVRFDGYLVDGRLLKVAEDLLNKYGTGVIVVNEQGISYEKSVPPAPTILAAPIPVVIPPTAMPTQTPTIVPAVTATPTIAPTPTVVLTATSAPTPTSTPSLTPRRLLGQPYQAENGVEVTLTSLSSAVVGMSRLYRSHTRLETPLRI